MLPAAACRSRRKHAPDDRPSRNPHELPVAMHRGLAHSFYETGEKLYEDRALKSLKTAHLLRPTHVSPWHIACCPSFRGWRRLAACPEKGQETMYLKEIENRPAVGMTKVAFRRLRDMGEVIPDILHLFRFKRRSTDHLIRFTEEVMRGPSPLSPGLRELIGAYFSKRNQYAFCRDAHAAAASQFLKPELVDEVLCDLETSRLDESHKALFRYIGKLADNPTSVTASDIDQLKQAGWSEEAIYDALTVASVFRFYNTWNAGAGVRNMTPGDYIHSGKVLRTLGYCMDFKLRRLVRITASMLLTMVNPAR